jgi:YVTN family beta-propeller protein
MSRSLSVVDTATSETVATIAFDAEPFSLAVDAAGARIYVTFQNIATPLLVIDAATNAVIGETQGFGWGFTGIALNSAGTRAYLTGVGEDSSGSHVFVIDAGSLAVLTEIEVGQAPAGISMHPDGSRVYVASTGTGEISVVNTATNSLVSTLDIGGAPYAFGDFVGPATVALEAGNFHGLWWKSPPGSESGWGVSLAHQGDILFATWFTYDTDGSALWLTMSHGAKSGASSYSGTLYSTTGPAFNTSPWNPSAVVATAVGTGTFTFSDQDNGTFTYTVRGSTQSKAITRQRFSTPMPTCTTTGGGGASPSNFQDLWWRSPAGSGSGWGVSLAHQGDILFAAWFIYDTAGRPQWLTMSHGVRTGPATYSGNLYRTTGPAFDANPWSPAQVTSTSVGTASFSFSDADAGVFAFTLDGVTRSEAITRQVFSQPVSACH